MGCEVVGIGEDLIACDDGVIPDIVTGSMSGIVRVEEEVWCSRRAAFDFWTDITRVERQAKIYAGVALTD